MRRGWISLACFALVGIGCGSDSGDSTKVTASGDQLALSKAEYIKQADAICEEGLAKTKQFQDEFKTAVKANDSQKAADSLEGLLQTSRPLVEKLRNLKPPPADQDEISHYTETREANFALSQALAEALRAGDISKQNTLVAKINSNDNEVDAFAQEYGFKVCGSGTK